MGSLALTHPRSHTLPTLAPSRGQARAGSVARGNFSSARGDGEGEPRVVLPARCCLSLAPEAGSRPWPQVLVGFPASRQESKAEMEKQNTWRARAPGLAVTQRQAVLPAPGTPRRRLLLPPRWLLAPRGTGSRRSSPLQADPRDTQHGGLPVPWRSTGRRPARHNRRLGGTRGGEIALWLSLVPDVTTRDCGIQLTSVFLPVTVGVSPLRFETDTLPWKTNACNKAKARVCRGRLMLACSRHSLGAACRPAAARPVPPASHPDGQSWVPSAAAGTRWALEWDRRAAPAAGRQWARGHFAFRCLGRCLHGSPKRPGARKGGCRQAGLTELHRAVAPPLGNNGHGGLAPGGSQVFLTPEVFLCRLTVRCACLFAR